MEIPRYGTPNIAYVSTWFGAPEDHAMWALNLMKYRPIAEYQDGRDVVISGADADQLYTPVGPLAQVGGRVMMASDVLHQLSGDALVWDRVAVAFYPRRLAMLEMQNLPDFQELHAHKDAAMDFTIVMATTPAAGSPEPHDWSLLSEGDLMLVQVSSDPDSIDFASLVPSRRIGEYDVRGVIVGDERTWARARFDVIGVGDVEALIAAARPHSASATYAMIVRPRLDIPA
jgi:hypothetical protein